MYAKATAFGGGSGPTGDVIGPASSTDNAIARFDGTTGKFLENSGATIDDSGNLTANNFSGTSSGTNTGDMTNAEVKTAYEANANTNAFTDAEKANLANQSGTNTGDMSNADVKTAYEANANTNAFTDAEQSKLAGIEPGATTDQSWGEIPGTLSDQTDLQTALDAKVTGPASATDNALPRFDATTGKLIQNSGVTVDDSNNVAGAANVTISGNIDKATAAPLSVGATNATTLNLGRAGQTTVVKGDLQVDGTTTTVNSTSLEVTDPNITVNNGGNQASADGVSGLTVEMSDATDVSLLYDSTLPTKWKAGTVGSEIELLGAGADAAKIHDGSVSNTEFGYLDGVTSSIQGQLNTLDSSVSTNTSDISTLDGEVVKITGNQSIAGQKTFSDSVIMSGDLTVDTNTLHVDSTNNRVGIGTASPDYRLSIFDSTTPVISLKNSSSASNGSTVQTFEDDMYVWNYETAGKLLLGTNAQTQVTIDEAGDVEASGDVEADTFSVSGGTPVSASSNGATTTGTLSTSTNYDLDRAPSGKSLDLVDFSVQIRVDNNNGTAINTNVSLQILDSSDSSVLHTGPNSNVNLPSGFDNILVFRTSAILRPPVGNYRCRYVITTPGGGSVAYYYGIRIVTVSAVHLG